MVKKRRCSGVTHRMYKRAHKIVFPNKKPLVPKQSNKEKYSIIAIVCKDIAGTLRVKYPDLVIGAHPSSSRIRFAIRRDPKESIIITVCKGGDTMVHGWGKATEMMETHYTAFPEFYRNNKIAKADSNSLTFMFADPDSITTLESWVLRITKLWFYTDTPAADVK